MPIPWLAANENTVFIQNKYTSDAATSDTSYVVSKLSCGNSLWVLLPCASAQRGLTRPASLGSGHCAPTVHHWWQSSRLWCSLLSSSSASLAHKWLVKCSKAHFWCGQYSNNNNKHIKSLILWFEEYFKGYIRIQAKMNSRVKEGVSSSVLWGKGTPLFMVCLANILNFNHISLAILREWWKIILVWAKWQPWHLCVFPFVDGLKHSYYKLTDLCVLKMCIRFREFFSSCLAHINLKEGMFLKFSY